MYRSYLPFEGRLFEILYSSVISIYRQFRVDEKFNNVHGLLLGPSILLNWSFGLGGVRGAAYFLGIRVIFFFKFKNKSYATIACSLEFNIECHCEVVKNELAIVGTRQYETGN